MGRSAAKPGGSKLGGKTFVPKPKRQPGVANIRIGNYRADVDTTGWTQAEKEAAGLVKKRKR